MKLQNILEKFYIIQKFKNSVEYSSKKFHKCFNFSFFWYKIPVDESRYIIH